MSSLTDMSQQFDARLPSYLVDWWPVITGLLVLYVPTYFMLAEDPWTRDELNHGPLVLGVSLWLVWRKRDVFRYTESASSPVLGSLLLGSGLFLYVFGRSQDIQIFEVASQILVIAGILLVLEGRGVARALWFPIFFLIFLIPLPGFFVDMLTGSMKQQVSVVVDELLYWWGYPIARNGVVLTIGTYQMQIADACSGLKSMYSLLALGVLFIYLRGHAGWIRNGILLALIILIAFVANIGRVIGLVLITYYFGDEAGQGYLHDFASLAEFVIALLCLFAVDGFLALVFRGSKH